MKKSPPTSEAALKRALKAMKEGPSLYYFDFEAVWNDPTMAEKSGIKDILLKIVADDNPEIGTQIIHWQGNLSEFYKKRQPLKPGVQKKIKNAIR